MILQDQNVLYISIHRRDCGNFFPVGALNNFDDVGNGPGLGFNINIPFDEPFGNFEMLTAFYEVVIH